MSGVVMREVMTYVGFGPNDAQNLTALLPIVEPHIPRVVDRFYQAIESQATTREIFVNEEQAERLRNHFRAWLRTIFEGSYDDAYADRRARIGAAHVRVGLPQHYMFAAMEIVWQELEQIIAGDARPGARDRLASLHKLITVEVSLMLESYRARYSERIAELEREALRDRLTRVEHLAEVGQLAASLAHEIKNPLAGISGAIQVIQAGMTRDDERHAILDEVLRQVRRVDGTVRDLLDFARPRPTEMGTITLEPLVGHVQQLLSSEPSFEQVRLDVQMPERIELHADANQLEQLLINLLLNAAQASPQPGTVELRVLADGPELRIEIDDEGPGIPAELRESVLEAFFTTKTRGTGLGLTIARRITQTHGGVLELDVSRRGGALIRIRLPRHGPEGSSDVDTRPDH